MSFSATAANVPNTEQPDIVYEIQLGTVEVQPISKARAAWLPNIVTSNIGRKEYGPNGGVSYSFTIRNVGIDPIDTCYVAIAYMSTGSNKWEYSIPKSIGPIRSGIS